MVKEKDLVVGRWYIMIPVSVHDVYHIDHYRKCGRVGSCIIVYSGSRYEKINYKESKLCDERFSFISYSSGHIKIFDEEYLEKYVFELEDYEKCVENEFPLIDSDLILYENEINKEKCEVCLGTGFYGDNGPGIKGNNEYQKCDYCEE